VLHALLINVAIGLTCSVLALAFDLQVQGHNDRMPTHVTATTQLADDFAAFPMTIDASAEPGSGSFSGKLSYAVDDLPRGLPPAAQFTVPAGYTKASSLFAVLFGGRSGGSPSPAPSATPTPH